MNVRTGFVYAVLAVTAGLPATGSAGPERNITYLDDVEPIIRQNCIECHTDGQTGAVESGLVMDSYASLMKGSRIGPVINPGSAMTSSLFLVISGNNRLAVTMPHGREPLSSRDITIIRAWIDNGAPEN